MVFFRVNNIAMNTVGEVAFTDIAFNPSTQEETSGLWMGDLSGLDLVIERGAAVTVAAGVTRTVEEPFVGLNLDGGARTGADGHPTVFSGQGELPEPELIAQALPRADETGTPAPELLADALSTVMLFLLFVAGEHLEPDAHHALHARVKAIVAG